MSIVLSEATENRLRERAGRIGQDVNAFAESLLDAALEWEVQDTEEVIAAVRYADRVADEGRQRPLADVVADIRAKYRHLARQPVRHVVISHHSV